MGSDSPGKSTFDELVAGIGWLVLATVRVWKLSLTVAPVSMRATWTVFDRMGRRLGFGGGGEEPSDAVRAGDSYNPFAFGLLLFGLSPILLAIVHKAPSNGLWAFFYISAGLSSLLLILSVMHIFVQGGRTLEWLERHVKDNIWPSVIGIALALWLFALFVDVLSALDAGYGATGRFVFWLGTTWTGLLIVTASSRLPAGLGSLLVVAVTIAAIAWVFRADYSIAIGLFVLAILIGIGGRCSNKIPPGFKPL